MKCLLHGCTSWEFSLAGHSRRRNWSKHGPSPIRGATCTRRWWKWTHQHQQPTNTNREEWPNGATCSGETQPPPHPLWDSGLRASWYERSSAFYDYFKKNNADLTVKHVCCFFFLICRRRTAVLSGILEKSTLWLRSQRHCSTSPGINSTLWSVIVTPHCSSGKYNLQSDDSCHKLYLNI